jgi:hypothetical protein
MNAKGLSQIPIDMTQFGSGLVAVALALTAYFAVAAWRATADDRRDMTFTTELEQPAALTQHFGEKLASGDHL